MKTDLQLREESFANMASRFSHTKISSLIVSYKIPYNDLVRLRQAANNYMGRCVELYDFNDKAMLVQYTSKYKTFKHITPNGLIVPKNHTILEYNILNQAFYSIIQKLNIDDFITSWHVPLNLRIKLGQVVQENLERSHPTEYIHSDSWAGESANSVTTMIPIFGDTQNNYVKFYQPPFDFQEEWLGPRPSYKDGQEIASRYHPIDFIPKIGELIISDFATTHASSRIEGAGSRVSIDTTFALKRHSDDEIIHPWKIYERAGTEIVNNIGTKYLFHFPDSVEQQVDSRGGFKHPTNLVIKTL